MSREGCWACSKNERDWWTASSEDSAKIGSQSCPWWNSLKELCLICKTFSEKETKYMKKLHGGKEPNVRQCFKNSGVLRLEKQDHRRLPQVLSALSQQVLDPGNAAHSKNRIQDHQLLWSQEQWWSLQLDHASRQHQCSQEEVDELLGCSLISAVLLS